MTEEFCEKNSFYFNVREDRPIEMSLEEFVNCIRSLRWKEQVEEYHRLLTEGEEKKAKELKNKMPGIIVAGRAEGTHALEHMRALSGDSMYDLDHCVGDIMAMLIKLGYLPWVKAAWRSISQEGLKIVVRIEAKTVEEYALAYAIVAYHITQELNFPCDMQCKNLSRPCYASYDPEAYYNPAAIVFPWREFAREHPEQVEQILAEMKVNTAAPQRTATNAAPAPGFLQAFLDEFLARHPFVKGKRNECLLQLGRVARYKGLSAEELKALENLALDYLPDEEYSPEDIVKKMASGYGYADTHPTVAKTPEKRVAKVEGPSLSENEPLTSEEETENELVESDRLRKESPYFPDSLFDRLPGLLTRGLQAARSKRERDILLMGMITNLSACMPGVQLLYAGMYYSPHLYFAAIAGAGRGKGMLDLAGHLPDAIQRMYEEMNTAALREYKKKELAWAEEVKNASKAKRSPDLDKEPSRVVEHWLKVSPNTSKSQLILALEANAEKGLVINASELDMVSSSISRDYGKYDDVFRAAFHHEEVSSYFKADQRQVVVRHPHLALCFAGTPAQLASFIPSQENGMFSRMGILGGQGGWEWLSAAPRKKKLDARALFEELSTEVFYLYKFMSEHPTEILFSSDQWTLHTEHYSACLQEVTTEKESLAGAIVLRNGLIEARIAMVLTALRKFEAGWIGKEIECTDADFRTAIEMADVLLEHSLLVSSSLVETTKAAKPLKLFFRLRPVLRALSAKFTHTEFLHMAQKKGVSRTSAKNYLTRLLELQILVKEADGYRKTGKAWPKKA